MKLMNTNYGIARLADEAMVEVLDTTHTELGQAIKAGALTMLCNAGVKTRLPVQDVTMLAPIAVPPRYFIVGLNYQAHADEVKLPTSNLKQEPSQPIYGIANGQSVSGPGQDIILPDEYPDKVDYEGEVGIVIGKKCENVSEQEAWAYVAGLTAVNDVSARDIQRTLMQAGDNFAEAKAYPSFKPTGPVLVTTDELVQPLELSVKTFVNGEQRQDGNTRDMIHDVAKLIAYLSSQEPLLAGDIVCTGTPDGVGAPQGKFLKSGDVVEVQIGDWPVLKNSVV